MKYLCLVYLEEKTLNALSGSERIALSDESMAYCEELQKNGHFIAAWAPSSRWRRQRPYESVMEKRWSPMVPLPRQRSSWAATF